MHMWQVKFRSSTLRILPVDHGNERFKYLGLLQRDAKLSLRLLPLLCVMVHEPLNDLNAIIRYAQQEGKSFVEIYPCLLMLRDYYAHLGVNPRRWRVARIVKLKKRFRLKHEFIVACLQCDGVANVQYLCLERMSKIGSGPGLNISAASDRIFSEENPERNAENKRLMTLTPGPGIQMSLPELLILVNGIHNISPIYKAFSANCYWFANAMDNVLRQHRGFDIDWELEPEQHWFKRWPKQLTSLIFRKSTATEEQMNIIDTNFITTQERFFDFQQPLFGDT